MRAANSIASAAATPSRPGIEGMIFSIVNESGKMISRAGVRSAMGCTCVARRASAVADSSISAGSGSANGFSRRYGFSHPRPSAR